MNTLSIIVFFTVACALNSIKAQSANGNGVLTFYDNVSTGACGTPINAVNDMLVAVSPSLFTSANPNQDPLCQKCINVKYKGKEIKVPIKDKCAGCDARHIDLSKPAFAQLENVDVGTVNTATWTVVNC